MNHCEGCYDNPCTCGKGYRHLDRKTILRIIEALNQELKRKEASGEGNFGSFGR